MQGFRRCLAAMLLIATPSLANPGVDADEMDDVTLEPEPGLPANAPRPTKRAAIKERKRNEQRVGTTSLEGPEAYLGPTWPLSGTVGAHPTMLGLGFGYVWDVQQILLEARGDFAIALGDAKLIDSSGTFGAHYVWFENDYVGFYSGLGFGVGVITGSADGNIGSFSGAKAAFVVAADTGALIVRNANVSMDVRLRAKLYTSEYGGSLPFLFSFLVGIHW